MSPERRKIYAVWFALHFFLVLTVSLRDLLSILLGAGTVLPSRFSKLSAAGESFLAATLGEHLAATNPLRKGIAAYTNCSGIEAGYSYFAPTVPGNCKLVFELHYGDGRVEYDLPHVFDAEAGYRIATLLDNIQHLRSATLRETILKMLVYSIWQKHPDATMIRAIFGVAELPTVAEFESGTKKSYALLYAFDFRFRPRSREMDSR